MKKETTFTVKDVRDYLDMINDILEKRNEDKVFVSEASITPETANTLGKTLSDMYVCLRKREDLEHKEHEKEQRYDRGYADVDVWNLNYWFIETVRPMLIQLRDTRFGSPSHLGTQTTNEKGYLISKGCHEAWDAILNRMIFLLGEMEEETCVRRNKYENEYIKASEEFMKMYGMFGNKLLTEEERAAAEEGKGIRVHTMRELPEYKQLVENYMNEEVELGKYRNECKNEFFELFSKYFWDLWD